MQCKRVTYLNPKVCVGLLIVQKERILLVRRSEDPYSGTWSIPAGFVEYEETCEAAARREGQEETGVSIELLGLQGIYSIKDDPRSRMTLVVFRARPKSSRYRPGSDVNAVRFFPLDDLPQEIAFSGVKRAIQDFSRYELLRYYRSLSGGNPMKSRKPQTFTAWASSIPRGAIDIWREAMAQLRRLSDDIWNGIRFFFTLNAALIAGELAFIKDAHSHPLNAIVLAVLAFLGLMITSFARMILTKQRNHYSNMLARKTMIEKAVGFDEFRISSINLSFPWSIDTAEVESVETNVDQWVEDHRRKKGSITRRLYLVYDFLIVAYAVLLLLLIVGACIGYFAANGT